MWWPPFLLLILIVTTGTASLLQPDNIFSAGRIEYRKLLVDAKSASLYVGARDHIFRLWIYNVNDTSSESLYTDRELKGDPEETAECERSGNSPSECASWLRLLFVQSDGSLLACTTQAMRPHIAKLDALTMRDREIPQSIIGVCSPHHNLNTTAVFVEFGNPDGLPTIYSGIRTGLSLENHLIYRPPLVFNNKEVHSSMRTIYTDSKWLNEPQFVGSYEVGQYVYFFFRELAVEFENCGRTVYSRVARICKNDLGGKNVLRQVFTSYVKARLNCSISSQFPFYFDHIQSVYKVASESDTFFYASFSTADSPFVASAVCHFSLNNINRLFDTGLFSEQPSVTSAWIQTPPEQVPNNRPGQCVSDSRHTSDADLHFAKSHLLMVDSVPGGEPIIHQRDVQFSTILVDKIDNKHVIFVYVPSRSEILKIAHWRESGSSVKSFHLSNLKLPFSDKVFDISLLSNEYLFVADEARVSQYRVSQCEAHYDCRRCAFDPYCSWNIARAMCFTKEAIHSTAVGWIPDANSADRCSSQAKSTDVKIYPGDATHLRCNSEASSWTFEKEPIEQNERLISTVGGGLVLMNATVTDSGVYRCQASDGTPIVEYRLIVDGENCAQPRTLDQFRSVQREWCKKYDNYKESLSKWQNWHERNSHCPRVPEQFKAGKLNSNVVI
ncbi:hypothetical protein QR680_011282 [Steinernema hermaphroditum]|uniref:Semaphorin-2A n=1 Tax=Steinernema hermaphroditum TaxID=289476 RepID=A0AA39IRR0_9BILA|nr:hypothetical protein QR680_011282 [Steinernema hermaphroditum]